MTNHIKGKVIIVTGAASGFGRLISTKAAALGANIVCADINQEGLNETLSEITEANNRAVGMRADVTSIGDMKKLAAHAIESFGQIDVMINNAGTMPLAFYADHDAAIEKWHQCIDINFKGVLNGIVATYDQMIAQGHGHVINISSIYGNFPVAGSAVYQATKTAVNYLSESLRVEARGKIKVTVVRPTGVPTTGLAAGIVNPEASMGIGGQNGAEMAAFGMRFAEGANRPEELDPNSAEYCALDPAFIADQVIHAIDQPKGVSIGDITVRATGDFFIL